MSDFIAAACVGIAQVSVGHPFETTLTLIQNNKKWKRLPIKDYYRGWRFPLCSAIGFNMTVFPIVERSMSFTNSYLLSGMLSGLCVAPFVFCSELGKVKQQTKQKININTILTNKGRIPTFGREMTAMSVYFTSYNYAKDQGLNSLVAGGLAGLSNWTLTYPLEVIKNRQMAQNISIKDAIKIGNIWKGYPICATRAVIVNSINFWTYETVKGLLDNN